MDGFEATRRIRAGTVHTSIPIVAVTANAHDEYREGCFEVGMNDFLAKPVHADQLATVVARWASPTKS